MKLKLTVILTTLVVTTGLLLGASTAQETEVIYEGNNATGIKNLEVDTVLYNVEFLFDSADNIYGDPPIFDFKGGIDSPGSLQSAITAVRAALNSVPAVTTVGPNEDTEYIIGYEENGPFVEVAQEVYAAPDGPWQTAEGGAQLRWPSNSYTYADFTPVESPADIVPIPRTGQTQSYYPGDDGDLQKGAPWPAPRFTDNGDGTVTDNLTGLIWMRFAGGFSGTWEWVLDQTSEKETGGYDDWRLPNRRELESLIDISRRNPAVPAGHPFEEIRFQVYWTSSSYPGYEGQGAWAVDLATGQSVVQEKDMVFWGWPVRDGN